MIDYKKKYLKYKLKYFNKINRLNIKNDKKLKGGNLCYLSLKKILYTILVIFGFQKLVNYFEKKNQYKKSLINNNILKNTTNFKNSNYNDNVAELEGNSDESEDIDAIDGELRDQVLEKMDELDEIDVIDESLREEEVLDQMIRQMNDIQRPHEENEIKKDSEHKKKDVDTDTKYKGELSPLKVVETGTQTRFIGP